MVEDARANCGELPHQHGARASASSSPARGKHAGGDPEMTGQATQGTAESTARAAAAGGGLILLDAVALDLGAASPSFVSWPAFSASARPRLEYVRTTELEAKAVGAHASLDREELGSDARHLRLVEDRS